MLKRMRQAGVDVVRYGTNLWGYVPGSSGATYMRRPVDVTVDEVRLGTLTGLGFTVNLSLGAGPVPAQYNQVGKYPVDTHNATPFAQALGTAVSKYSAAPYNISYFEFHNEPDLDWYPATNTPGPTSTPTTSPSCKICGGPLPPQAGDATATSTPLRANFQASAASYVRELGSFASQVRAIRPDAVIVNGGVAFDNIGYPIGYTEDWLRRALEAGLAEKVDVIAFHFYPRDWYVPLRFRTLGEKTALVKDVVADYTSGTKMIWANESGLTSLNSDLDVYRAWATPPALTDPQVQAGQIVRMNAAGQGKELANQVWFNFKDLEDPVFQVYAHSGLVGRQNGASITKPSLNALLQYGREVSRGAVVTPIAYPAGPGAGGWLGFTFRNAPTQPQRFVSIIWSDQPGTTSNYTISSSSVKNVDQVLDMFGTPLVSPTPLSGNAWVWPVGNNPIYLKWRVGFVDVDADNPFYRYIDVLAQKGIISGYSDYTFRWGNNLTREQAMKIVAITGQNSEVQAVKDKWAINTTNGPHFSDVPVDSSFYQYIETAFNNGTIAGYGDGTFRPNNITTRGQLSKIVVGGANIQINTAGGPHFSDVPVTNPFYQFVETAHNNGVISGYADGTFRPGEYATRGQFSKMDIIGFDLPQGPATPIPTPTLITTLLPSGPTPVPGIPNVPQAQPTAAAPLSGPSGSSSSSVPAAEPSQPASITAP